MNMKNLLFFISIVIVALSCEKEKITNSAPVPQPPYSYLSSDFAGINDNFYINVYTLFPDDSAYSLGKSGIGQKWDYSTIPLSATIDTINFFDPSSSPDYYLFTNSNINLKKNDGSNLFLSKSSEKIDLVGIVLNVYGIDVKDTLDNPLTKYKFPMTLGSELIDSGSITLDTQMVYFGFPVSATISINYRINSIIDASGSVKTPTGTYDCVRDKRVEYTDMNVNILGMNVYSTKDTLYQYNYWTKAKKWNVIEITTDQKDKIKSIGYLLNKLYIFAKQIKLKSL